MALISLKDVINNIGYYIPENQRNLFTVDNIPSIFGFDSDAHLQFSLYDVNGAQLTMSDGSMFRYIPLTSINIGEYLLISQASLSEFKFKEYFVDVKKLIIEAGYSIGTFRTKVSIISRRVGAYASSNSLWISEISPSRTEIRLRPQASGQGADLDLLNRFKIFLLSTDNISDESLLFSYDIKPYIGQYINQVVLNDVFDGDSIFTKIKQKFNLDSSKMSTITNEFVSKSIEEINFYLDTNIQVSLFHVNSIIKNNVRESLLKYI